MSHLNNILLVSSEFPPGPGGIGQHAYSLAVALAAQSKQVVVLTEADYASSAEIQQFDQQQEAIQIFRNSRMGWKTYPNRLRQLKKLVQQYQPTLILVSGKFSLWAGAWLKLLGYRTPIWAFLHGSELQLTQKWERQLTNWSLSRLDRLFPVSRFTLQLLPKKLQPSAVVIPNGLILHDLSAPIKIKAFPQWKGSPRLLTVGSVTPRKGQHRVVKALPTLLAHYPDLHYHIVGLPIQQQEVLTIAKVLGVEDHLTFHGKIPERADLYAAYQSADVFIMLSENQPNGDVEGFGIAILEANYFGLPAIGASGCGIEDAIQEGKNGFLVDGDVAEEILQALEQCVLHRQELQKNAKDWASAHDWNRLVNTLFGI